MDIVDEVAPVKCKNIKKNNVPWFDSELKNLFIKRDKIHNLATSFNDKSHPIWDTFREFRNSCKRLLKSKMILFFENKTQKYFNNGKKFWQFYNIIIKTKKSKDKNLINSILNSETGKVLNEPNEITETFNKFFTNISMSSGKNDQDCNDFIDRSFLDYKRSEKIKSSSFSFSKTNSAEIVNAINRLDIGSSCGNTLIPVSVIKHCALILAPILASIFNSCVETSIFPDELKHALGHPLFKKGDPMMCDNYRGISVLSPFTKIFESILSSQINHYFSINNLFSTTQHGFRANHSCETALQTVIESLRENISKNKKTLALFVDFKKAFDLVEPKLLWRKLFHYGFDNKALGLIENYFNNRTMSVCIGKNSSSKLKLNLGVPQGSILGPLLFIIYINDLGFDTELQCVLFADDTTLIDCDSSLKGVIDKFKVKFSLLNIWFGYNKLFINWSKTKFMIISNVTENLTTIRLDETEVEVVEDFKLLGITLDNKLSFTNYVNILKSTINKKLLL